MDLERQERMALLHEQLNAIKSWGFSVVNSFDTFTIRINKKEDAKIIINRLQLENKADRYKWLFYSDLDAGYRFDVPGCGSYLKWEDLK